MGQTALVGHSLSWAQSPRGQTSLQARAPGTLPHSILVGYKPLPEEEGLSSITKADFLYSPRNIPCFSSQQAGLTDIKWETMNQEFTLDDLLAQGELWEDRCPEPVSLPS